MDVPGTNLAKTLYQYSRDKKFTDFTIRAGDRTVHCHKLVLRAQSSYFDSLCASGLNEANLDRFTSSEIDGKVLNQVVQFIYLERAELTKDIAELVLHAAEFIKRDDLKAECGHFMIQALNLQNCKRYSNFAEQFHLSELNTACKHFQRQRFSQLTHSDWFLPGLSADEFANYLGDNHLTVTNEDEVLGALLTWLAKCNADDKTKGEYINQLVPHVRLSFCNQLKLESLVRDEKVPALLKVKLYEYLYDKKHRPKHTARASYSTGQKNVPSTTPMAPPSHSHAHETLATASGTYQDESSAALGGDTLETLVLVIYDGTVMFQQDGKWNRNITKSELHVKCPYYHPSVCTSRDRIIVSSGYDDSLNQSSSSVHQFSFTSNKWSELPKLLKLRTGHAAVIINEQLYTLTGFHGKDGKIQTWYRDCHVLDLRSRSWSVIADNPLVLRYPAVAVVHGDIIVTGGYDDSWNRSCKTMKYSPQEDSWTLCKDIPAYEDDFVRSTVAVEGCVYVLTYEDFYMYDAIRDEWARPQDPTCAFTWLCFGVL